MNSQTVLGKVMALLSIDKGEVKLTVAKLADGTLVESPTFDVGETLEVIHEDGTKTPAPDGEHLLELRDESDNINRIKIFTEGGIIKERENVEIEAKEEEKKEEEMADVSTEEVEALPETGKSTTDVNEQVTLESEPGIAVKEEVVDKDADIVNLTTKLEEQEEKIEEMKERIEELVKYFEEIKKEEESLEEEKKEENELESKKLDGAPVEKPAMMSKKKINNFKVPPNYTNSVLSKMYR
jgi:tRNA U34 5-carboxymethylaminomethyl modifying enzyme MnmG/GidA